MTSSILTLSDLERSKSRSVGFQSLISRKGAELGHMLLLAINRKPCMASPMTPSHLTLSDPEWSKSRSLRFWVVGDLYGIDLFICQQFITTLIWMSQKGVLLAAGFSAVPAVFLIQQCFAVGQQVYTYEQM